jgi:uncharacterized protein YcfJ
MTFDRYLRPVAAATATCIALFSAGCAMNADGSFKKNEDGTYVIDDKAKGALIGAALGCAVGSAAGKGCAQGAVVGAVAGFLVGWYFESKKIADAKTVNAKYARTATKPPANDVVPVAFSSQIQSGAPSATGEKEVQITSTSDFIGYGAKKPEAVQKFALYDQNNKLVEEKSEKITAVDGAGTFQTSSKFKLPASAKGQTYTAKTELVVDGKPVKQNTIQVAFNDAGHAVILASAR